MNRYQKHIGQATNLQVVSSHTWPDLSYPVRGMHEERHLGTEVGTSRFLAAAGYGGTHYVMLALEQTSTSWLKLLYLCIHFLYKWEQVI